MFECCNLEVFSIIKSTKPATLSSMFCDKAHISSRLCLIDGFARRASVPGEIPIAIARLCDKYHSKAFYWSVGSQELEYLLSDDAVGFSNTMMSIGQFSFHLNLRNEDGNVIFEIIPLHVEGQCQHKIYCELYCLETQTQLKSTFLFNTTLRTSNNVRKNARMHIKRYPHLQWSSGHLTAEECRKRQRLTFTFCGDILDEARCQSPFPPKIEYLWHLRANQDLHRHRKWYSPNFCADSWCLWHGSSACRDSMVIGLQLLRLPVDRRKGVMFRCKVEWEGSDGKIEFIYFLDLMNAVVEIGHLSRDSSWIKVEIECEAE